jgi:hypothetical protein
MTRILAAAAICAVAFSLPAMAVSLQPIAVGAGGKLLTTEVTRDDSIHDITQHGHDISLRNGEETTEQSANTDWRGSVSKCGWTLDCNGDPDVIGSRNSRPAFQRHSTSADSYRKQ